MEEIRAQKGLNIIQEKKQEKNKDWKQEENKELKKGINKEKKSLKEEGKKK